ncbi:ATPase [Helicobacter monodelphidis]|uniref:zeta toxin family protein n=1 Tax=Helicobacter sp. 15-1451 TaxID=2004995 RepID=UPI000DCD39ED|nr:zeta toxin family protein [Helicobacter sp. 15-1451]RAX56561.1 ATPase [Helicobacter sp. 15-1451]
MKVFIFAGVNGAGKTTLYYNEIEKGKDFGRRINIDEIVSSFGDWKNQSDQIRASKIAINLRNSYIQNAYDFNLETTLCGSSIIALFKKLQENGYSIYLYYVKVKSVDIAKNRVKQRVKKGGHNISEKLIEKRFKQSSKNLETIIPFCKQVLIFDNSESEFQLVERESPKKSKI